jgi:thymidine phosphorylase
MQKIIKDFISYPSESNMHHLIEFFKGSSFTDEDIIQLTKGLADSGNKLSFDKGIIVADIPSTGGPTSLTTLLCPLVLQELGFYVPKIGVPGRPAGGIDVLHQIPNYKTEYSFDELKECIKNYRYCHSLANESFAPLDKKLFNYRSKVGAKAIIPLVISSLLSKKIAVGINNIGLDVRVFQSGNFGTTRDEAYDNSLEFIRISKLFDIHSVCFLNELTNIQQPYVGRGEALIALYEIFYGNPDRLLSEHYNRCVNMGLSLVGENQINLTNITAKLKTHFINNLKSQGASEEAFIDKVNKIRNNLLYEIKATTSGFLDIDLDRLRSAIVWGQIEMDGSTFSDPCGVVFETYSNDYVEEGEVILRYRADSKIRAEFKKRLLKSISIKYSYCVSSNFERIE